MTVLKPYSVDAYNLAKNSENKMHDDSVARRFGFQGGLVPGVEERQFLLTGQQESTLQLQARLPDAEHVLNGRFRAALDRTQHDVARDGDWPRRT